MKRENLLKSPAYWVAKSQTDLYNILNNYLHENKISRNDLAMKLGVTRGYISQVLNGSCDHRLSKIYQLSLAIGKVPTLTFQDLDTILDDYKNNLIRVKVDYTVSNKKVEYDQESPIYDMDIIPISSQTIENLKNECNG